MVKPTIVVYGAAGHTGRFVVRELVRRGFVPVLGGRDGAKLDALQRDLDLPDLEARVASVDDPEGLDRMLGGAAAVVNCAGPFVDTATPVIEAALRGGVHYLDVAAEQAAVLDTVERFAAADSILILPAVAFYGGLPDLLATKAMGDWDAADDITVAVALDSWHPTVGTRLTGARNPGPRYVYSGDRLTRGGPPPPPRTWTFPEPFGDQAVVGVPFAESIVIPRHLRTPEVRSYLTAASLEDISDPATPPPTPADPSGRSAQVFLVEVVVTRNGEERRAAIGGQDIYFVTAPIVVEAAERAVEGRTGEERGVLTPGEAFDASDFLRALAHKDPTNWLT